MDPLIEELCGNNDPPADEVVQKVKDLLLKPRQDLKDIDFEILTLERRVQELKTRRNDTEKWIVRYQSILSPMRTLPRDVLAEIFQHCLTSRTNPIVKGTSSPLLLTRVCRSWRNVARSEPRLWSRIHIAFMDLNHLNYPAKSQDEWVLQKRLDAVKEWMSRSGTTPLSLSIHFHNTSSGPRYTSTTMDLLQFLAQLSPRFEDLEVHLPFELFRQFETMLNPSQMTNLVSFRISALPRLGASSSSASSSSQRVEPLSLLKTPNLRRVFTFGCDSSFWGISDPSYESVWSKLTNLSCHRWFSKSETVSLLARTPNLVHLAVIIYNRRDDEDILISHQGPISLPLLRTLFLTDAMPSRTRGDLYERIDAPGLKVIMFATTSAENNAFRPIPIIPLLTRATGLEKLSEINPSSMGAWDMRRMFRAVPSVTHLFVGNEWKTEFGVQDVQRGAGHPKPQSFDFQLVLPGNINDHPVLPNLQSFEINSPFTAIDGENFLRFIKSRMAPPSTIGISGLKHVAAGFYCPQGPDLVEDVRRRAWFLGVEMIDLVLCYEKPPTENTKAPGRESGVILGYEKTQTEKTKVPGPESGLMKPELPTGLEANVNNYIRFRSLDSDFEIPK